MPDSHRVPESSSVSQLAEGRTRLLSLKTSMEGERDVFLIDGLSIHEEISRPFRIELKLLVKVDQAERVSEPDVLGQTMAVGLKVGADSSEDGGVLDAAPSGGDERRFFHGIVGRLVREETDMEFVHYRAELIPWLSLLDYSANCRVFERKSVLEIVSQVFDEWLENCPGLGNYRIKPRFGDYKTLDYCVQYRESDFQFVSRLMEHEGLFYFFEHDEDGHCLVIADAIKHHEACRHQNRVRLLADTGEAVRGHAVTSWSGGWSLVPRKYALGDYQFQTPLDNGNVENNGLVQLGRFNSGFEVFDYPGMYAKPFNEPEPDGDRMRQQRELAEKLLKNRMEEAESRHRVFEGSSNCVMLEAGRRFKLVDQNDRPVLAFGTGGEYVLTSVTHSAEQSPDYVTGRPAGRPYHNRFRCIPLDVPFRPVRRTSRPVIQGLQTAVVVGPDDQEIYTDKFGRVRVRFHWERDPDNPIDRGSCWLRVAQPMAGQGWGAHFWPRIGHEVVVAFLEGDPDQPLIVGSLYNGSNKPPYDMPDQQTRSGIKTRSTPEGAAQNFNEIRFDDKKGKEQVYLHAERNLDTVIKAGETRHVGGSQVLNIKKNRRTVIDGDDEEQLNSKRVIARSQFVVLGRDVGLRADEGLYLESQTEAVIVRARKGKILLEGETKIVLRVGDSSLTIDHEGITLQGMTINVEATMGVHVKGLAVSLAGSSIAIAAESIVQIQ
jgi:type VI secretion system secreted protein VgrG